jgi:hypothetical protein
MIYTEKQQKVSSVKQDQPSPLKEEMAIADNNQSSLLMQQYGDDSCINIFGSSAEASPDRT